MNRKTLLAPAVAIAFALLFSPLSQAVAQSYGSSKAKPPKKVLVLPAHKDIDSACMEKKLDDADRLATASLVGFALPAPPVGLQWVGMKDPGEALFQGKVALIVNSAASGRSRTNLKKLIASLGDLAKDPNVVVLAIQTPDGAKVTAKSIEKKPWDCAVVIDTDGGWCDTLGLFKDSVILGVDRRGNVRAAGLSIDGAPTAVKAMLAEPYDAATDKPTLRPKAEAIDSNAPFTGQSGTWAGKDAPEMVVSQWMKNATSSADGKIVVLDFWATWCPPCRAAIPHMNEIQRGYPDDVVCVGLTNETKSKFEEGCAKYKLDVDDFSYGVALDPSGSMQQALSVKGIPHVFVISADWKIRWDGHPTKLTEEVLRPLVESNRELVKRMAAADPNGPRRAETWAKGTKK